MTSALTVPFIVFTGSIWVSSYYISMFSGVKYQIIRDEIHIHRMHERQTATCELREWMERLADVDYVSNAELCKTLISLVPHLLPFNV